MNTTAHKPLTMADVIILERAALEYRTGGFVYCNKPYPCGVDEALSHFRAYQGPVFTAGVMAAADTSADGSATIERKEKETIITIKPIKGSRARKPYVVRLWS